MSWELIFVKACLFCLCCCSRARILSSIRFRLFVERKAKLITNLAHVSLSIESLFYAQTKAVFYKDLKMYWSYFSDHSGLDLWDFLWKIWKDRSTILKSSHLEKDWVVYRKSKHYAQTEGVLDEDLVDTDLRDKLKLRESMRLIWKALLNSK